MDAIREIIEVCQTSLLRRGYVTYLLWLAKTQ
jgi:hypothetical protein